MYFEFPYLGYYLKSQTEICYLLLFFLVISISMWYWYLKMNKNQIMVHWPVVDMLPSILLNKYRIHDWMVDLFNVYGRTIFLRGPIFARLNIIFTCDPRNVEYILKTNFSNFPKGADFSETFDLLGDGILNVDSDLWHAQRRIARTAFALKDFRLNIANTTQKMVHGALLPLLENIAKESAVVDLEDVFLRYTFDTAVSIIFGRNPSYLSTGFPPHPFAQAMDEITEGVLYRHLVPRSWWKLCRFLAIGNEGKMRKPRRILEQYLSQYILRKKEDIAKGTKASDLLQIYMSLKEGEYDKFFSISNDKFFTDTAMNFLFAGRDTAASALTWFFWLLSKNPSVEAKILEELKLEFLKNNNEENGFQIKRPWVFNVDDLTRTVYLHAALCEALRLYPPVPLIRKEAIREEVLPDGTVVKPTMMIIISIYAMGRMQSLWGKDCLDFNPERWIDGDGKLDREAMSKLMVFNIGPRICIGKDMAFVLMKSAASAILFNFHVEVLEGQKIEAKPSVVLQMKEGMKIRIKERIM